MHAPGVYNAQIAAQVLRPAIMPLQGPPWE